MSMADLDKAWASRPTNWETSWRDGDAQREEALPEYKAVVSLFLSGDSNVVEFRSAMDSLSNRRRVFGFGGTSQMFLNQMVGSADQGDLEDALRAVIVPPTDAADARQKLQDFSDFIETVRQQATVPDNRKPAIGRTPAFVSFFWELAERDEWPAFYPSSRGVLTEHGLLEAAGSPAEVYPRYREVFFDLRTRLGPGRLSRTGGPQG
jgi:hypothetical protein